VSFNKDSLTIPGNLYLKDNSSNQLVNLKLNDFFVVVENNEPKQFQLFWGNYGPMAEIINQENKIYRPGEVVDLRWNLNNPDLIEYQKLYFFNEEDTLIIAPNFSATSTHFSFVVPDNIIIHYARFGLDIIDTENLRHSFESNFKIGILPSTITLSAEPDWQLVANPWIGDVPLNSYTVFGDDSQLYEMIDHEQYEEVTDFKTQTGYWLFSPNGSEFTSSAPIIRSAESLSLEPAWNLIANPHFCPYKVSDLFFSYNGIYRSFKTMVNMGIIADAIFIFEDNGFKQTELIQPGQSFFLYSYSSHQDEFYCSFNPYKSGSIYLPPAKDWQIKLNVSQYYNDDIILGTSPNASEGFDLIYDLPEPPSTPFSNQIQACFVKDGYNFPFTTLNQEFKHSISSITDSLMWDFTVKPSDTSAITLTIDLTSLPADIYTSIFLDGNSWCNLVNNVYIYSFTPSNGRLLAGKIIVTNRLTELVSSSSPVNSLSAFPNPFNPRTVVSFELNRKSNVKLDVYNVRGQIIKNLLNTSLSAGEHRVEWNGRDKSAKTAASGIYFMKLETANQSKIIKTILLK
jgi:hypothetical protein